MLKTAQQLVALAVTALVAELEANTYPDEVLDEAIELELAKSDARKTAFEALEAAKTTSDSDEESPKEEPGYYVNAGKSLTTLAGIKTEGQAVTAAMLPTGEKGLKYLTTKKYLRQVK